MESHSSMTPTPEAGARKERPILFSAPMIRAILDGSKRQTRRIIKPAPVNVVPFIGADDKPTHEFGLCLECERVISKHVRCPYGQPGDRLWVRETWAWPGEEDFLYRADLWASQLVEKWKTDPNYPQVKWKPSIYMPRRASRITLEVESVRVERLQGISEEDARAEGVKVIEIPISDGPPERSWRAAFAQLWREINGPESWDASPWVWVVAFKRIRP